MIDDVAITSRNLAAAAEDSSTRVGHTTARAARLRGLVLRAARLEGDAGSGAASTVLGEGLDFEEVRAYTPGDDVRSIDWNVTARMRTPFVKRFRAERERRLHVVLDNSGSMACGGKAAAAAEVGATLALLTARAGGTVSLIAGGPTRVPASRGRPHALQVAGELFAAADRAGGPDQLNAVLRPLLTRRRSQVLLLSDFFIEADQTHLTAVARRHTLQPWLVFDPIERTLPQGGVVRAQDPETGRVCHLDCGTAAFRTAYADRAAARVRQVRRLLPGAVEFSCRDDPDHVLRGRLRRGG